MLAGPCALAREREAVIMTGRTEATVKGKDGRPRHKSSNRNACHIDQATVKEVGNGVSSPCFSPSVLARSAGSNFHRYRLFGLSPLLSSSFDPVGLCFTLTPRSECEQILFPNFGNPCRVHTFYCQGSKVRTESLSNKVF